MTRATAAMGAVHAGFGRVAVLRGAPLPSQPGGILAVLGANGSG